MYLLLYNGSPPYLLFLVRAATLTEWAAGFPDIQSSTVEVEVVVAVAQVISAVYQAATVSCIIQSNLTFSLCQNKIVLGCIEL